MCLLVTVIKQEMVLCSVIAVLDDCQCCTSCTKTERFEWVNNVMSNLRINDRQPVEICEDGTRYPRVIWRLCTTEHWRRLPKHLCPNLRTEAGSLRVERKLPQHQARAYWKMRTYTNLSDHKQASAARDHLIRIWKFRYLLKKLLCTAIKARRGRIRREECMRCTSRRVHGKASPSAETTPFLCKWT